MGRLDGDHSARSGDEPLSGDLYAANPQGYRETAAQLVRVTAHRVPENAKTLYWHLLEPVIPRKLAKRYAHHLQGVFEASYVLAISEVWAELDDERAMGLIDAGVRNLIPLDNLPDTLRFEPTGVDPDALFSDDGYRLRNVPMGFASHHECFKDFTTYVEEQPSYRRVDETGRLFLLTALEHSEIKRRHRDSLQEWFLVSFRLGVALGLVDRLGELPAVLPDRV